jgi:hypothetical protein
LDGFLRIILSKRKPIFKNNILYDSISITFLAQVLEMDTDQGFPRVRKEGCISQS